MLKFEAFGFSGSKFPYSGSWYDSVRRLAHPMRGYYVRMLTYAFTKEWI